MKKYAIIVAGGSGSRMNTSLPKQFMPLTGVPVLAYSIIAFHKHDPETEIIVVLPDGFEAQWKMLAHEIRLNVPYHVVKGGHERFYSVLNALNHIKPDRGLVAIHDAARPFISQELIHTCYSHAQQNGCAIPAIPVKDSLRAKIMDTWAIADRSLFRAIQTPQVFDLGLLKAAYTHPYHQNFTDDASVYENAGNNIYLVDGEDINFKITTQADFEYAEYLTEKQRVL